MATGTLPDGIDHRAVATGIGSALVVLGALGAVFLVRPNLGFALLFGGMVLGFFGAYLAVQHRSVTEHRGVVRTADGEGEHLTGARGGFLGAWILGGSLDEMDERASLVALFVSLSLTLAVGCLLLIFLAHPVANALASITG